MTENESANRDLQTLPSDVDVNVPSAARMYDFYLGGKDNFASDREAAERVLKDIPETKSVLRASRAFLGRAVRYLVGEAGITQFIDLGTGLPTQANVHQIAHQINPRTRVAYVDNDPIVRAHGQALLATSNTTAMIQADLREPELVLNHPDLRALIDLSQPVAVLLFAVLHFIDLRDDAPTLIAGYRQAMAPGSYLALSTGTTDGVDPDQIAAAQSVYKNASAQLTYRSREEIMAIFDGFDLVEPGLVRPNQWRPVSAFNERAESEGSQWMLGGVGRLRDR